MQQKADSEICEGCGARFRRQEGPTHAYMDSVPRCWELYGRVLAREYENTQLFSQAHVFTVDAYALQHPGNPADDRALQSVWVHYLSLHMVFDRGANHRDATLVMQQLAGGDFPTLPSPRREFAITVRDLHDAKPEDHAEVSEKWARCAYEAWSALQPQAEDLLRKVVLPPLP